MHTTHTNRSHSRGSSHFSHEKNTKVIQLEIDHLKRSLHHEQRKRAPSKSDFSSDNEEDSNYRHKLRTPPSESFSYDGDYHHERSSRNSSSRGLGNDAMSKAPTKFPYHLSRTGLRERDFLGSLLNPCSPCIMVELTLWSMLATLIKEWLCTPRMRP